jgi:hypothetical protein
VHNSTSLFLPGGTDITFEVNDRATFESDASGNWRCVAIQKDSPPARGKLTASRTYYVRPDGIDSNDGRANTAGGAFQTIQKAIDVVAEQDIGKFNVTIQLADGTYTAGANINSAWLGSGMVTLLGNTTTPSNVHINLTSGTCITANNNASIRLSGLKLSSASGGFGIYSVNGSNVTLVAGIEFGTFGTAFEAHIVATQGGRVSFYNNYAISGGAYNHMYCLLGGSITADGVAVTLTGTPAFAGGYVRAAKIGNVEQYGSTFVGSATGPRYSVSSNAVVDTAGGGASYFPGNSAGSTATGGQYT